MKITLPKNFGEEPNGRPFSMVLSIEGKEVTVTSGTVCSNYDGTIPEDIETQTKYTILACERALKDAGCTLENVFNVEVYMKDLKQWDTFNQIYGEMMPNPKPCRKALEVGLLPGYLVEIVMWAVK